MVWDNDSSVDYRVKVIDQFLEELKDNNNLSMVRFATKVRAFLNDAGLDKYNFYLPEDLAKETAEGKLLAFKAKLLNDT